jgi:hypothetical protein
MKSGTGSSKGYISTVIFAGFVLPQPRPVGTFKVDA